jgi:large subunit ribosomal protein L2
MLILLKKKPYSPGSRAQLILKRDEVTYNKRPYKSLSKNISRSYGISFNGVKSSRTIKSSKNKRLFRIIDWKRDKDLEGIVMRIEIDPNRSSNIALINYPDGEKRYILAPKDLTVGSTIIKSNNALILPGNAMELGNIPVGTLVHCIEIRVNQGAKLCRSAGSFAKILSHEKNGYTKIELSSKEIKFNFSKCIATIGIVGNMLWRKQNYGKAGKRISFGERQTVRGTAMNTVDHPHGGGEGKQPIGRPSPVNKNGKSVFSLTRNKRKIGSKLIVTSARSVRIKNKIGK